MAQTFYDQVLAQLASRHEHVKLLQSTVDWDSRRSEVRDALMSGLFAPMPPVLRHLPRTRDAAGPPVRGDGFEVRKLLVETRPHYWVPCSLWIPDFAGANVTAPALLYSAGHEGPAWRWDGADDWLAGGGDQVVLLNLVQRGFVVLAFDPLGQGERQMYTDLVRGHTTSAQFTEQLLNGTQAVKGTFEHEYIHRQLTLLGTTAAASWVWDMTILTGASSFCAATASASAYCMS